MGKDAKVYLGSAELAAVTALLGHLPDKHEYLELYRRQLSGSRAGEIYRYLNFHELSKEGIQELIE